MSKEKQSQISQLKCFISKFLDYVFLKYVNLKWSLNLAIWCNTT